MKKYEPLMEYLKKCNQVHVTLSYEQIEKIIGTKLPQKSPYIYREWWSNNATQKSRHSYAWLEAGYKVSGVKLGSFVVFERT